MDSAIQYDRFMFINLSFTSVTPHKNILDVADF